MKHGKQELREAMNKTAKYIEGKTNVGKMAKGVLTEAKSIKDVIGISDDSIESIYSRAYVLYNSGRYKDAAEVFRLMIVLNPLEPKYLMGLAACHHMLKEYRSAAATYNLVSALDPKNPVPFFHSSDCYLQMGDQLTGAAMLEMAVNKAKNKTEFATLFQRATITLEGIKKGISAATTTPSL